MDIRVSGLRFKAQGVGTPANLEVVEGSGVAAFRV